MSCASTAPTHEVFADDEYLLDGLRREATDGRTVTSTVYLQAHDFYRTAPDAND
jgi:hypothetical protein